MSGIGETIAPTLPFGDINLVVLTDVHSWVAGHGGNGPDKLDASYGDVVSFYEQLNHYCHYKSTGNNRAVSNTTNDCDGDLWLVQNGDWIDGTGLAMDGDASSLISVLQQIPFDVLNTGNHDLYRDSVISQMRREGGFLDWWGPRHLASNVYMNATKNTIDPKEPAFSEPLSNRFHVLNGKRSTVLVFGFIYNMPDPGDLVVVQTVEEAVRESWFVNTLQDTSIGYNAVLVMLHAGIDDPSVEVIRKAIRTITQESIDPEGNLPIQFVAGHTHMRRHAIADSQSTVVESGKYMDTVGWISFPNSETIRDTKQRRILQKANFSEGNESMGPVRNSNATTTTVETNSVTNLFHHVFLDANRATLRDALGIPSSKDSIYTGDDDEFQTALGKSIASFIEETRDSLGLTEEMGCAPRDYFLNQSMVHEDSLWRLYRDEVGPHVLKTARLTEEESGISASNRILFMSQDSWRFGLYGGNHVTRDDLIAVSPFDEPIYRVSVLPCSTIRSLEQSMNTADEESRYLSTVPAWILAETPADNFKAEEDCELYVNHFCLSRVQTGLQAMNETRATPWNPIESNLSTTNIWLSFVQDRWQCPGIGGETNSLGWGFETRFEDGSFIVSVLAVSLFLLLTALMACRCVLRRRGDTNGKDGYDGVMLDPSSAVPNDINDAEFCINDENDEGEPPVRIV